MNTSLEKQFVEMEEVCGELGKQENEYHESEDKIDDLEYKMEQCVLSKLGKAMVGFVSFFAIMIMLGLLGNLFPPLKSVLVNGVVIFFILLILIPLAIKFVEKEYNIFKEKDKNMYLSEIKEEQENLNGILTTMRLIAKMNDDAFKGMPEEYIYSIAIEEMHKYVRQGRANSIPEAINLYEEQLHRWKIEEQNGQLLDSQYRQEQRLANIEFYSSISAFFD